MPDGERSGPNLRVGVLLQCGIGREGLCHLLESLGFELPVVASEASSFIAAAADRPPQAAIISVELGMGDGLWALAELTSKCPSVRSVALGRDTERFLAERCRRAGARGFVTHSTTSAELVEMLGLVIRGGVAFPAGGSEAARQSSEGLGTSRERAATVPSPRELEVLHHVALGEDNLKIATLLGISERTVKSHVHNLYRKLHADNRVELALGAEVLNQR